MKPRQDTSSSRLHLQVLTGSGCEDLYQATLECLTTVGVDVDNQEARELLQDAGALIEENRAYIPPAIIQGAIDAAPSTFSLWGRDGTHELSISPNNTYFGPGPTCTNFIDPQTGERRQACRGDAGTTARVCDALENIDYVMSLSHFVDVTPVLSPVYEFAEMVTNTTKPVIAWANDLDTLNDIYQVALAVVGSRRDFSDKPIFCLFVSYESPLHHLREPLANMLWATEHGIPIVYIGGPTVGLESPFTGASALVIHLAAALSGLAIVQLKRPGTPVVIAGIPAAMDLRNARPAYGSPELSLYSAAATDLANYLGLPFMSTAGASESKLLDSQAAVESSLQILMSSLSGASLVHDVGFLDCADIGSLPLLVLVDEVIGMVKRIMRGIQVDRETIMLDLIEKVGPRGYFLSERQSASLSRVETWVPNLIDRDAFEIWKKKGGKSMEDRINLKLQNILDTHTPAPLPSRTIARIKDILTRAEKRVQS